MIEHFDSKPEPSARPVAERPPSQPETANRPLPQLKRFTCHSTEEVNKLLSAAERYAAGVHVKDIITIVLNTGLSVGELRDLRWKDVDLEARHMYVSTRGLKRKVPFGPKTLEVFQARRERQTDSELVLGKSPQSVIRRVTQQIRTLSNNIGKSRFTLASLRHTFVMRWVRHGSDDLLLDQILGFRTWTPKVRWLLSAEQRYSLAAEFQARLEVQE
jgi:integrase/recombinase XerD